MEYLGFELLWFDLWVGFFYDQKKGILYFCPLPCFVFKWRNTTTRAVDFAPRGGIFLEPKGSHESNPFAAQDKPQNH